jgi:hypothetical protein
MAMLKRKRNMLFSLVLLFAAGCATIPAGPSVMVMPAPGKPFDLFQREDAACRQYAQQQIGISPQDTVNNSAATGAVIGGVVGAGLGSLSGRGTSTALGAAGGALFGAAVGADSGRYYGYEAQRRYDIAYEQCMYANGNIIPGMRYYRRSAPPPPPPPDLRSPAPEGR